MVAQKLKVNYYMGSGAKLEMGVGSIINTTYSKKAWALTISKPVTSSEVGELYYQLYLRLVLFPVRLSLFSFEFVNLQQILNYFF